MGLYRLKAMNVLSNKIINRSSLHNVKSEWIDRYATTEYKKASFWKFAGPEFSRPVSLCQAPIWGLRPDFYHCQTVAGLLMWGALSDERTGLLFTIAAGPRQRSHFRVRVLLGLAIKFYSLRFETSLFVASYDLQRYGGGIRPRLHIGW
jgi:hypothetical protein